SKTIRFVLTLSLVLSASVALGQDDPFDDTSTDTGSGDTPLGGEENPTAPDAIGTDSSTMVEDADKKQDVAAPKEKGPYPQRFIDRPIIVYKGMIEASADLTFATDVSRQRRISGQTDDGVVGAGLSLRARFAITDEIEVGLRWGAVSLHEAYEPPPVDSNITGGRALQADFVYQVFDWLGAQASIPFYVDPFAMGITLGAPMQGEVGPLQFFGLRDLVTVKIAKFMPFPNEPVANEVQAQLDEINFTESDGRVNINFGVAYQQTDAMAFIAESGIIFEDFDNADNEVPLKLSALYARSNKLDVGAQIGSRSLDEVVETFFARVFVNLRI
ncbi:MAG: hypothetical protein KJO07_10375, partial [Deltaproteobacteria bacterium]|nr:hypothetical protein [Deltaproteobacteria bacterium]